MPPRLTALGLVVIITLILACVNLLERVVLVVVAHPPKLDPALLRTEGKDVWFEALTEEELRNKWSYDDGEPLKDKVNKLTDFNANVLVDVRLVGFDGTGHMQLNIEEAELQKYLDASGLNDHQHSTIINVDKKKEEEMRRKLRSKKQWTEDDIDEMNPHLLPFRVGYMFKTSRGSRKLVGRIEAAIQRHIDGQVQRMVDEHVRAGSGGGSKGHGRPFDYSRLPVFHVPFHITNGAVYFDYQDNHTSYTQYILNLKPPTVLLPSGRRVRVRYVYDADEAYEHDEDAGTDKEKEETPATTTKTKKKNVGSQCPTVSWLGDGQSRYTWIDLTAGPISYGPRTAGQGIVTELSLPRVEKIFKPRPGETNMLRQKVVHVIVHVYVIVAEVFRCRCIYISTDVPRWATS